MREKKINDGNREYDDKKYEKLKINFDALLKDYEDLKFKNCNIMKIISKTKENEKNDEKNKENCKSLNASFSACSGMFQLSREEFEEYDNLRKNKDENEALIMQLKSNCEARDMEILELKNAIEKIKRK